MSEWLKGGGLISPRFHRFDPFVDVLLWMSSAGTARHRGEYARVAWADCIQHY
jgi:hypothetical protein